MKYLTTILLPLVFTVFSFGQTATFSYYAITNSSFEGTPEDERFLDDLYAEGTLFVTDGLSLYREHLADSILQKRMGGGAEGISRSKLKSARKDPIGALYLKDFTTETYRSRVKSYDGNDFGLVEEPLESMNWVVTQEEKMIGNYLCIKANVNVYGRTWEAWFSPEIPVSDGPWKLYGLAGLIVEAKDLEGKFRFLLTKVQIPATVESKAEMDQLRKQLAGMKFGAKTDFVKAENKKKDERKRARIARMTAAAGEDAPDVDIKITFAETIEKY